MPLPEVHLTDFQHTLTEARRVLGEHAFADARAPGQALALEAIAANPIELLAGDSADAKPSASR